MPRHASAPTCLIAAATVAALMAGCSNPATSTSGDDARMTAGTSIVIGAGSEPDNLNPVLGYAPNGASKLFDGLVDRAADLSLRPALATALPTVSPDGLTWTADLRPDVRFSDGAPVTADDVVFTYQAVVDPASASPIASDFDALKSVRAVDSDTVEFRLKYAYEPWGQRLALGIVPRKALAGQDMAKATFNRKPIGTGPYRLSEWRSGERMVLKANPEYYRGAPAVTDVTLVFSADDNVRAQRMAAGEFDATVLPPRLAASYESKPGFRLIASKSADYRGVGLPGGLAITSTPDLRRAVNLAIDRQAMVDTVLAGRGRPAATPVSPAQEQWYDPAATFSYDPAQAEQLLAAAGWVAGADRVRVKSGTRAVLPILYPGGDVLRKELALAAASDLTKVGIAATAESATFEQMLERAKTTAGLWGGGDPFDPDSAAYSLLHSKFAGAGGYVNMTQYRDARVDAALDAGRRAKEPPARQAAYRDFQTAFVADPGWAFLVFLDHTYVVKDGWTGLADQVEPHDHGFIHGPWWNIETWKPTGS